MMNWQQLNEDVAILSLEDPISSECSRKVAAWLSHIEKAQIKGVNDLWPSFNSIAIQFDRRHLSYEDLKAAVADLGPPRESPVQVKRHQLPVTYHETSQDMKLLEQALELSVEEIIKRHCAAAYQVAFLGFLPGFPYLLGLPEALHCPRKQTPATHVPAGSVAIGGSQTGIYPFSSPGGWHVLGTCKIPLFQQPDRFLLQAGDYVSFEAV